MSLRPPIENENQEFGGAVVYFVVEHETIQSKGGEGTILLNSDQNLIISVSKSNRNDK